MADCIPSYDSISVELIDAFNSFYERELNTIQRQLNRWSQFSEQKLKFFSKVKTFKDPCYKKNWK